ncbi:nucleoid-associated protein, YbaB/EbfC family [Helicobacter valdiviensis]|uniref:Nucleoid-associated protein B6S12_06675 n=1 Tax=Helicobacter valdiviensis TaxID=1458358 RepID=A0A2W6MVE7_9HELI|nr:YbaB/EbfC family nucleoid-associated protein [Helicobacter valdiviensis]PZT47919.1 nucleoid-associated protein, YbaB/EbfC family [Helicobacter valdiviensis]
MFNTQDLAKTLGNLQEKLKEAQEENKQKIITAKSGGGLISVSANGEGEIIDISIDDSLLEDKESMQILLMSAINDVYKSVESNRKGMAMDMLGNLGNFGDFPLKGL